MDQNFILFETQRLQKQCHLCNGITDELFTIKCIETVIKVCLNCHNVINNNDNDKQLLGICWHMLITDIPYCSKVLINLDSQAKFYNLKFQECQICCVQKICCKICMNDHYFCIDCTDTYVQQQFSQSYRIPCPDLIYITLIGQIMENNKRDLFCIKQHCYSQLTIHPYQQIESSSLQKINQNMVQCQQCKTKICNTCRNQINGSQQKHQQYCNQLALNQFKIYCQDNLVQKCPKCRILSQPRTCLNLSNPIQEINIQQCQLCNTKFCILCKSAQVVLFPQMNQYLYDQQYQYRSNCQACTSRIYSKKNKCKKFTKKFVRKCFYIPKILRGLCKLLFIIIWLPGYQFMQVSKIVGDFVDNKINKIDKSKAPYFFCCCGPIIAFSIICSIFILYAILFIPLFIRNCYRKIKGLQL